MMKRTAFFTVIILCIAACNNEVLVPDLKREPEKKNQCIELRMSEATRVSVYSAATENECTIDSIWALEFNGNTDELAVDSLTGNYHYELIDGSRIINNGHVAQLLPQLSFNPAYGNLIVCIANCDSIASFAGLKKSNINAHFSSAHVHEHHLSGEPFPMYGEITWPSYMCMMTRAVAKIQVQMGTTEPDVNVTGNFTAENVTYKIFDGSKGGFVQPATPLRGLPQTAAGTSSGSFCLLQKNHAAEAERSVYLYEYPTSITDATGNLIPDDTFRIARQHIILEKDNGNGNRTYYRLDFYNPATGKFIDTKRNHHYLFTIKKIRSEGYATLEQARRNPGSNMEYTLIIDGGSESVISNGQYAIVTSVDTAYVPAGTAVSDYTVAMARYQTPQGMSLDVSTVNTIAVTGVTSPGSMTLGATGITALSTADGKIKVTTNSSFTEGIITLRLGNITHRLPVKAKP